MVGVSPDEERIGPYEAENGENAEFKAPKPTNIGGDGPRKAIFS